MSQTEYSYTVTDLDISIDSSESGIKSCKRSTREYLKVYSPSNRSSLRSNRTESVQ